MAHAGVGWGRGGHAGVGVGHAGMGWGGSYRDKIIQWGQWVM